MKKNQKIVKRAFDAVVATIGIIALLPLGVVIALVTLVTSKGPLFFIQERIGQWGESFNCIKFRTMRVGSENRGTITEKKDARITRSGAILRRFKLDELPQLWNILIGQMSFVGPRPDVAGYADCLVGEDRVVLSLRPGITGPATLYFRYEEEILAQVPDIKQYNDTFLWPIKVAMNRDYLESYTFIKDIGYIAITVVPSLNRWFKLIPTPPTKPL